MVGSSTTAGDNRSKEAIGMMALHEALRNVCLNTDWTYSVFWTIRPRPRCRGGNGCKVGDDSGSLMLMWEDGFCRSSIDEFDRGEDPIRKAFGKMSIQLYNYGEGLMGKVASDKCHKWVFKEPSECEPNISNYWQSSFDAIPQEWSEQFSSGIQTIAVIQAGHGLLQLGSCKIIPEDLHFVLRMRHMFESLGYQSGFYLSQLFSSTRSTSPTTSSPMPKHLPNWSHRPTTSTFMPSHPAFHGIPRDDNPNMFHQLPTTQVDGMVPEHDPDLKWPNGLSFFTALTGRADESSKLLFGAEEKAEHECNAMAKGNAEDRKMEFRFKRSFMMPAARGSSSSSPSPSVTSSSPLDATSYVPLPHHHTGGSEGVYSDIMETFLD